MRSIFRNLTTAEGTRAVLTREELLSALPDRDVGEAVLRQLVDARLLTSYETEGSVGETSGRHVEILHESLLTAWPRLVRWQTQSADGAQLRDQLRQAAHLWQERGKAEDLLWTGASYLEYLAWRDRYEGGSSSVEEDFAKAMSGFASRKRNQRRIAIAAAVAALVLGRGAYLNARGREAAHVAFVQQALLLRAAMLERLSQPQESIRVLATFMEVSGGLTRQQFRLLAAPMLMRHRAVQAFEWLPFVRQSERTSYESEARAAGLSDYSFWEVAPDGAQREAGSRPFYVPVHYMEPPGAGALGFDVASDAKRRSIAEKARDRAEITASNPLLLAQDTVLAPDTRRSDTSPAVALYAPIYAEGEPATVAERRAALTGFAVVIFRVAPLMESAASQEYDRSLAYILRDAEAPNSPTLAERPLRWSTLPRRAGFELKADCMVADRKWVLEVVPMPGHFEPPKYGVIEILSAVLAAVLGLAVVTLLKTLSRRRRQDQLVASAK